MKLRRPRSTTARRVIDSSINNEDILIRGRYVGHFDMGRLEPQVGSLPGKPLNLLAAGSVLIELAIWVVGCSPGVACLTLPPPQELHLARIRPARLWLPPGSHPKRNINNNCATSGNTIRAIPAQSSVPAAAVRGGKGALEQHSCCRALADEVISRGCILAQ